MFEDSVKCVGDLEIIIEHKDGLVEHQYHHNKVVLLGRTNMVKSLANKIGGSFQFYISQMQFGSGGTVGGTPRVVEDNRQGLFGPTILSKGVIVSIDPFLSNRVVFTSVATFDEAVGQVLNEACLRFNNGDMYSMLTFGDISKSSGIQMTFNWRQSYL